MQPEVNNCQEMYALPCTQVAQSDAAKGLSSSTGRFDTLRDVETMQASLKSEKLSQIYTSGYKK